METMSHEELTNKKVLINKILTTVKAGGGYVSGEMFFNLAYASIAALKKIASDLGVK